METGSAVEESRSPFQEEMDFNDQTVYSYQQISCLDSVARYAHVGKEAIVTRLSNPALQTEEVPSVRLGINRQKSYNNRWEADGFLVMAPVGTWRAAVFPSPWRGSVSHHLTPLPPTLTMASRTGPAACRCQKVRPVAFQLSISKNVTISWSLFFLDRAGLVEGSVRSLSFGCPRQKVQWCSHSSRGHLASPSRA